MAQGGPSGEMARDCLVERAQAARAPREPAGLGWGRRARAAARVGLEVLDPGARAHVAARLSPLA
jgi:hypothetical protein